MINKLKFSFLHITAFLALMLFLPVSLLFAEAGINIEEKLGKTARDSVGGFLSIKRYRLLQQHDNTGTEAYNKFDFITALKEFRESIKLSIEIFGENNRQTAHRYLSLGLTSYLQGEYDQGIQYYNKALKIYAIIAKADDPRIAGACLGLAEIYLMKGKYDTTIEYSAKSLAIYTKDHKKYLQYIGTAYYDIGMAYIYKGKYDTAKSNIDRALDNHLQASGEGHLSVATDYYALGEINKFKGNYNTALDYYQKALAIYIKTYGENNHYSGTAYYAMAYSFNLKGEFDKATAYNERARNAYVKVYGEKHPYVAASYGGLGLIHISRKEYDKAIHYYEKSLEIYLPLFGENHINTAAVFHDLGLAYELKGDLDKAIYYYRKNLSISQKVLGENHPEVYQAHVGIGKIYILKDEYNLANQHLDKALAICTETFGGNHPRVADVYNHLANLFAWKGEHGRAFNYYDRALSIIKDRGLRQETIDISNNRGSLYYELKEFNKARASFEESIRVIEQMRVESEMEKTVFMQRNMMSYYYSLIASARLGDLASLFRTAESMKARGFLDRISLSTALTAEGIGRNDRDRLIALNDDIERLASQRSQEMQKQVSAQDKNMILRISKELEEKEKAFNALDARLMKNEKYRSLRKPRIATLDEARAECTGNTAILEYIINEDIAPGRSRGLNRQSYCLVIKKTGEKLIRLKDNFDYSGAIMKYRKAVIDRARTNGRNSLEARLYDQLIAPLDKELAGIENIIIIPDGALAFLPFDALREKAAGPYLCERFSISLSPSVSVMRMVDKRRFGANRKSFLAFGGAVYSQKKGVKRGMKLVFQNSNVSYESKQYIAVAGRRENLSYYGNLGMQWDNIPGTLDEVVKIENVVYNNKKTRVLTGAEVSETKIKELSKNNELAQYKSVHFACHGYFDPDIPSYSAVVLSEVSGSIKSADDGYLSVSEAALLRFQADIVNLSACETGLGRFVQGDGIVGLARAFQEAGANRVGVSLWEVADESTRDFMVNVYNKVIRKNMPFGAAVTQTKREFIKSGEFRDPYFWAAFVLYGR